MIVACPYCSDELDVPPSFAGRPVRCDSCQAVFTPPTFEAVSSNPIESEAPQPANPPRLATSPRRSSPAGVWGLVLLTLIVTVPSTVGCIGAAVMFVFPHFDPVIDDLGRYHAIFPGNPEPVNRKDDAGRLIRGYDLQRVFPPERYFVYYVDLPKAIGKDPETVLAAVAKELDEFVPPGSTETGRESASHDGSPALDVWMHSSNPQAGTVIVRCILAGKPGMAPRLYVVGLSGPVGPHDTRVKRFFTGFRLSNRK